MVPNQPGLASLDPNLLFGEDYYAHGFGSIPYARNEHWINFFGGIAENLIDKLRPRSVYDVGCAWGFLVEAFRDRGVEARGCDISSFAISEVRDDIRPYCTIASASEPIPDGPYDLVTCIEVLEHMEEWEALKAVDEIVKVTDTVLFSSTPDDFTEPTHINVQPILYWLEIFAKKGFYPDLLFDANFVAAHAFLLRRRAEPLFDDVLLLYSQVVRGRIDRTAFLQRQARVEQLEVEKARLTFELQRINGNVSAFTQEDLRAMEAAISKETDAWRESQAELLNLRSRLRLSQDQLADARSQVADAKHLVTETAEQLRQARQSADLLPETVQKLASANEELPYDGRPKRKVAHMLSCRPRVWFPESWKIVLKLQARSEHLLEEWRSHCVELSASLEVVARRKRTPRHATRIDFPKSRLATS